MNEDRLLNEENEKIQQEIFNIDEEKKDMKIKYRELDIQFCNIRNNIKEVHDRRMQLRLKRFVCLV